MRLGEERGRNSGGAGGKFPHHDDAEEESRAIDGWMDARRWNMEGGGASSSLLA